jgi:hypothetical protein
MLFRSRRTSSEVTGRRQLKRVLCLETIVSCIIDFGAERLDLYFEAGKMVVTEVNLSLFYEKGRLMMMKRYF